MFCRQLINHVASKEAHLGSKTPAMEVAAKGFFPLDPQPKLLIGSGLSDGALFSPEKTRVRSSFTHPEAQSPYSFRAGWEETPNPADFQWTI